MVGGKPLQEAQSTPLYGESYPEIERPFHVCLDRTAPAAMLGYFGTLVFPGFLHPRPHLGSSWTQS